VTKWLSTSEVQKLRKHCKEKAELDKANGRFIWQKYRAIVEFLLGTGLRASEALDTQIKDLCLNGKKSVDDYLKVRTLKRRKKVEDVVMINKELANALKDYLQQLKLFRPATADDDYLFPGRSGKKSPLITIEKAIKKIFNSAGLPDYYSVHSLRHTHGFHIYNENKNLKLVQVRLRHSSIQTAGIYTGVTEEEERETINNLYE
jgi:site-specific recombinase XerD